MLAAVLSFIGGFLSAVFAEPLRRWLFRPRLTLEFKKTEDFICRTPLGHEESPLEANVVRVRVTNSSATLAKSCRAYLVNVERWGSSEWEPTVYCESIQLAWSARGEDLRYAGLDLPKNVPHFIDVLSTQALETNFQPAIQVTPLRYGSLFRSIGKFRFTVVVSGDDVRPARLGVSFKWMSDWKDFEVSEVEPAD